MVRQYVNVTSNWKRCIQKLLISNVCPSMSVKLLSSVKDVFKATNIQGMPKYNIVSSVYKGCLQKLQISKVCPSITSLLPSIKYVFKSYKYPGYAQVNCHQIVTLRSPADTAQNGTKILVLREVFATLLLARRSSNLLLMMILEDQQRSMSLCTLKKSKVNRGLETKLKS
ncbi:hypothetical protein AVEN_200817-1 [Araneus ventricosus]|uniref:Uncharacterized protein n=1 Tax=Araneus ventricosus TaxID=182803 RepID=A0A4Y2CIL0_ARAVE|nr:hypothetical protein AVEN_200817-1 [Araneus ventricosus]